MLLKNYIVELNLMNGSVGIIKKIVYENKNGPKYKKYPLPACVIVEFKNVCLSEEKKAFPMYPNNWIPIPVTTDQCEKRCCSITTIPLRVCKALTIHKSQGMTIGQNECFEKAIIYLPDKSQGQKITAGLELVAMSRVTSPTDLAIGNRSSSLCIANLKKIGVNKTNEKIKKFHEFVNERSIQTCELVKQNVRAFDQIATSEDEKTYENGCEFLLKWFNQFK